MLTLIGEGNSCIYEETLASDVGSYSRDMVMVMVISVCEIHICVYACVCTLCTHSHGNMCLFVRVCMYICVCVRVCVYVQDRNNDRERYVRVWYEESGKFVTAEVLRRDRETYLVHLESSKGHYTESLVDVDKCSTWLPHDVIKKVRELEIYTCNHAGLCACDSRREECRDETTVHRILCLQLNGLCVCVCEMRDEEREEL